MWRWTMFNLPCPMAARAFHAGLLSLSEIAKPAVLRGRGGVRFGSAELRNHLGVEARFDDLLTGFRRF